MFFFVTARFSERKIYYKRKNIIIILYQVLIENRDYNASIQNGTNK